MMVMMMAETVPPQVSLLWESTRWVILGLTQVWDVLLIKPFGAAVKTKGAQGIGCIRGGVACEEYGPPSTIV
jgi:hypothetical protein